MQVKWWFGHFLLFGLGIKFLIFPLIDMIDEDRMGFDQSFAQISYRSAQYIKQINSFSVPGVADLQRHLSQAQLNGTVSQSELSYRISLPCVLFDQTYERIGRFVMAVPLPVLEFEIFNREGGAELVVEFGKDA